jgi:Domain of unknown function (DUF4365)
MSDRRSSVTVSTTGPSYLAWRGELLAELALAGVPELVVTKLAGNGRVELGFDFLAAAQGGLCFFVQVKAYSSLALRVDDVAHLRELRWPVPVDLLRRARQSRTPVFLFLFDADTDHGRYLRLDKLPETEPDQRQLVLRLPVEHTINRASAMRLIADLHAAPAA